jgi:hypothetical protein
MILTNDNHTLVYKISDVMSDNSKLPGWSMKNSEVKWLRHDYLPSRNDKSVIGATG